MAQETSSEGHDHRQQDDASHDRAELQALLDRMARAITAGDGKAMAALWEVPAIVIGADGVIPVAALAEVESFFGGAKEQYNQMGIVDTRADIAHVEWANQRVAMVRVRWPYIDQQGRERGQEQSTYTLRRDDRGDLKVRAVVMHGASGRH
jgi:hypothetical protein